MRAHTWERDGDPPETLDTAFTSYLAAGWGGEGVGGSSDVTGAGGACRGKKGEKNQLSQKPREGEVSLDL